MRKRAPGLSGAFGSSMFGQRILVCWLVRPATEYGNSMADVWWSFSRAPQRNAANTLARSRTESGPGAVRSIPYTARANPTRSSAACCSASDFVRYTVPSGLRVPSRSPCTGEYRLCASHCIQSQAASTSHGMPMAPATSLWSGSARMSGRFAAERNASRTAGGICGRYRLARADVGFGAAAPVVGASADGAWAVTRSADTAWVEGVDVDTGWSAPGTAAGPGAASDDGAGGAAPASGAGVPPGTPGMLAVPGLCDPCVAAPRPDDCEPLAPGTEGRVAPAPRVPGRRAPPCGAAVRGAPAPGVAVRPPTCGAPDCGAPACGAAVRGAPAPGVAVRPPTCGAPDCGAPACGVAFRGVGRRGAADPGEAADGVAAGGVPPVAVPAEGAAAPGVTSGAATSYR